MSFVPMSYIYKLPTPKTVTKNNKIKQQKKLCAIIFLMSNFNRNL